MSKIPPLLTAFSGGLGGTIANATSFPLDLVTTRLQVQNDMHTDEHYSSILDAFQKIYRKEGLAVFYDGLVGDSAATMLQAFLYFYAYDFMRTRRVRQLRLRTGRTPRTLGAGEELAIGSLAGIFCKFFTSPINNVVTRQQTASLSAHDKHVKHAKLTTAACIKQIYAADGISGFWAGFKPTLLLSFNPALTHYFFQWLSARFVPRSRRHRPKLLEVFLLAAVAKSLASILTYPVIMAKTRSQVDTDDKNLPFYTALYRTYKGHGFHALYDGASGQILKGFFNQGITMMTRDKITHLIISMYVARAARSGVPEK